MAETLARCTLDPDVAEPARVQFFDSAEQAMHDLDRDRIGWLYETWQIVQEQASPTRAKMSPAEFYTMIDKVAREDDPRPFVSMRPGLRWIFTRTLADLWLNSQKDKSPTTSPSETSKQGVKAGSGRRRKHDDV